MLALDHASSVRLMDCKETSSIPLFSSVGYKKLGVILAFLGVCTISLSPICHGAQVSDEFVPEVPPAWFKVGTYVEYRTGLRDWSLKDAEGRFRWECINLSGHVATVNFTLVGFLKNGDIILEKNVVGYIDVNTRDLIHPNGTVIGKIALWLPTQVKEGQKVVVYGKAPNQSVAECFFSGGMARHTCQGYQEGYAISARGQGPYHTVGGFDMDTGLCQSGRNECLRYLDFCEVGILHELVDTNVDLGPRYLRTEILVFLFKTIPISAPTITIATIAIILYRKRQKHKKLKMQQQQSSRK